MDVVYETLLPRRLAACTVREWGEDFICGSEEGIVRVFLSPRFIGIYCARGHLRSTQWVGHEKFLPGAEYADANVPLEYLSKRVTKKRASEYRPNEAARMRARRYGHCFICKVPPAKKLTPIALATWLSQYDLPLFRRLCDAAKRMISDKDVVQNWPEFVGADLYHEAVDRARNSGLELDHLFPVDILASVREKVGPIAFHDGAKNIIVPLCGICNRGRKAIVLEDAATLEDRLIDFMFEGKPGLAEGQRIYESFRTLLGPCEEAAIRKRRRLPA